MVWRKVIQPQEVSQEPESFAGSSVRNLAGGAASLVRGVAKLPAEFADIALGIDQKFKPAGQPKLSSEQLQELQLTPKVEAAGKQLSSKLFPKDYLEPQSSPARFIQKGLEALPSFYAPGGGFKNAIVRAFGSEGGRELAKHLDLGETGQFLGSIAGAGLAAGLLTPSNLKNAAAREYNSFEKSIPKGAIQKTSHLKKAVQTVQNMDLLPDDLKTVEDIVIKRVEPWLRKGTVSVNDAWRDKKFIQKALRETKGLSKDSQQALRTYSRAIVDDIIDAQKQYPGLNPQGLLEADSIYYGLQNLSPVRKFLRKYITPASGVAATVSEGLGNRNQQLKELMGGLPLQLYGAGVLGRGAAEIIEPVLKSRSAAREVLGKTLPQVASGLALSQPKKEPKKAGKWRKVIR